MNSAHGNAGVFFVGHGIVRCEKFDLLVKNVAGLSGWRRIL